MGFTPRTLGRTGLTVSPLGLSPGGGSLPSKEVERAFEGGIRYFYWGSYRAGPFADGVRALAPKHRDEMRVVVQSYTRAASLMRGSLTRALSRLGVEYADLLLLGWWNQPPPERILEAAMRLKEKGLARYLMISCHNRTTFARYAADPRYGAIMVRYNASHPGAESDVFPTLGDVRPGVVAYTATRWGNLLDPELMPEGEPHPRASDCYRFTLSASSVDVTLCAPRNAADLDEALATLERGPMSADELAWMKRVGAHVKKLAGGAGGMAPVAMLDRIAGWLTPTKRAGLDTRSD